MITMANKSSPPSYIDGISVKISEKYKPPKRIAAALSYSQRLTLNKLMNDPMPTYEFTLEESVKNRMHEWRKARSTLTEERKQRLENFDLERDAWINKTTNNPPATDREVLDIDGDEDEESCNHETDTNTTTVKQPYYSTESGVLIPITIGQSKQFGTSGASAYQIIDKSFNFSEFESDTSSPFDNMELKTINDLEELAEVLKRDHVTQNNNNNTNNNQRTTSSSQSQSLPLTTYISLLDTPAYSKKDSQIKMNGYSSYSPLFSSASTSNHTSWLYGSPESHNHKSNTQTLAIPVPSERVRTVTEIMQALQTELQITNSTQPQPSSVSTATTTTTKPDPDLLDNPFQSLTAPLQELALQISKMGFPLARVARACQNLDGNQKKIVEHLLAMAELLDLGFTEQNIVTALLKTDNNRDKALDLLIT